MLAGLGIWRQLGIAQPVVAHLALLIGIGDRPGLQSRHRLEGPGKPGSQLLQLRWPHVHTTDIQPDAKALVKPEQLLKTPPLGGRICCVEACEHVVGYGHGRGGGKSLRRT